MASRDSCFVFCFIAQAQLQRVEQELEGAVSRCHQLEEEVESLQVYHRCVMNL